MNFPLSLGYPGPSSWRGFAVENLLFRHSRGVAQIGVAPIAEDLLPLSFARTPIEIDIVPGVVITLSKFKLCIVIPFTVDLLTSLAITARG